MNKDEQIILDNYRCMNAVGKAKVLDYIDLISGLKQYTDEKITVLHAQKLKHPSFKNCSNIHES